MGGGGALPDFFFYYFFSLFSRPRAGLPTVYKWFFGFATNTLNVRNNNNNNIEEKSQDKLLSLQPMFPPTVSVFKVFPPCWVDALKYRSCQVVPHYTVLIIQYYY